MKNFVRNLTVLTAVGLVCGQAYAQEQSVVVADSPVHAVPADDANGPVEDNAVPDTLNAQYAAQSKPQPAVLQSKAEEAPAAQPAKVEGPSAAIAPRIIESAAAFEAYMRHATAIQAKFADGPSVGKAMSLGAAYEITQFQEGATAYAALVALQDPAFVQGVFDIGRDPRDRAELVQRLVADPKAVMEIDGADEAAAMVGGLLAHMGTDLVGAGQAIKQSAYSVQTQSWSKEDVPNAEKRLADTKAQGAAKASLNPADTDALIKTLVSLRKAGPGEARNGPPTPVVLHGLAIAALAVWGRAGETQIDQISPLLSDAKSADCMKMAKLNLYQCMAAAGPEYEDVFCLGAHAMVDTGQCVIQEAGQSPIPAEVLKASAPVRPSGPASISVPMALTTTMGPERQRAYAARPQADARVPAAEPALVPPPAPRDYAEQDAAPPQPTYAPAPAPRPSPRQAAPRDDYYDDAPSYYDRAPAQQPSYAPQSRAYQQGYRDTPYADPYGRSYYNTYNGYYGYGR